MKLSIGNVSVVKVFGEEWKDDTIAHPFESVEYCREFCRKCASTIYHPVGTFLSYYEV